MKTLITLVAFAILSAQLSARNPIAPAKKREFFDDVTLPVVDLKNRSLTFCLDFATCVATELDNHELDPKRKGFKVQFPPKKLGELIITYRARNVTLTKFLWEIARRAKLDVHITSIGVVFCRSGNAPFPNAKDPKEVIWETLYRVPQKPKEPRKSE